MEKTFLQLSRHTNREWQAKLTVEVYIRLCLSKGKQEQTHDLMLTYHSVGATGPPAVTRRATLSFSSSTTLARLSEQHLKTTNPFSLNASKLRV